MTSVIGFAIGSIVHIGAIGAAGSEPSMVTAINGATNQLTLNTGLLNAHAAGEAVLTGPAGHRNNFGGTSSATPLFAGVAALVLSANPSLTNIEARQFLRDTAFKFDLTNTDPVGQWLDANGNPSVTLGLPAVKSGWYGYGCVDAAAAVQTAILFATGRDPVIRDNLSDTGAGASTGAFWNTPDIWCRTTTPGMDPSALPANYTIEGPHQDPIRGQPNWVYARVHNNGTAASLDAWVRISVTHWPEMEFTYPTSFQPTNGPGDPLPSPMTPGTYFIGEAKVIGTAPGGEQIVNVEWPSGLIPPSDVMTPSGPVHWHPCLLAEVTPHDGPMPMGNHVWDYNDLAQKNISIVGTDSGQDFAIATVIGHEENPAKYLLVEIHRGSLPQDVQLYVDLLDPTLHRRLHKFYQTEKSELLPTGKNKIDRQQWSTGWHEGREVVLLKPQPRVQVPVLGGEGRISPLVVGGIVKRGAKTGTYEVVMIQRQPEGEISGSATLMLQVGKVVSKAQTRHG